MLNAQRKAFNVVGLEIMEIYPFTVNKLAALLGSISNPGRLAKKVILTFQTYSIWTHGECKFKRDLHLVRNNQEES